MLAPYILSINRANFQNFQISNSPPGLRGRGKPDSSPVVRSPYILSINRQIFTKICLLHTFFLLIAQISKKIKYQISPPGAAGKRKPDISLTLPAPYILSINRPNSHQNMPAPYIPSINRANFQIFQISNIPPGQIWETKTGHFAVGGCSIHSLY